jgi:hypothetical protein
MITNATIIPSKQFLSLLLIELIIKLIRRLVLATGDDSLGFGIIISQGLYCRFPQILYLADWSIPS